MGDDRPDELEDESSIDLLDGRLSAIMPRKLFQDDAAVKSGLLQVFVRMKPLPESTETCMVLEQNHLLKASWRNTEAVYKFSKVFQQDANQAAVYEGTTAALVEDFLDFRQPSAVVMAYGVTSAGKTFTMQGTPEKPGLVPLALKDIFQTIGGGSLSSVRISLSVCEIYNECIHDLLAPPNLRIKQALRLKEDKSGHIQVQGMSEVPVRSSREALELLKRAGKARQSAGTGVNERSSRSHAVITVKLQSAAGTPGLAAAAAAGDCSTMPTLRQSFLHFVDLAGCERVKRTGNSGARLRESVAINSSLMTLARCLEVLRYNQQHPGDEKVIPYRESKITHLFKSVLHGNGRFVMLVNVSPACEAFNETKRVLQYAALASKVTMTSEVEHEMTGQPWPAAAGHALMPADECIAAASTAAADAAAVNAAAMLSAAQARIEELLDDKADLEYEIDVVERKVELLREELIRCEVEKEQLESEIRAEVQEEMNILLQEATAQEKAKAAKAKEEAVAAKEEAAKAEADAAEARQEAQQANVEADIWKHKVMELEQQLQQQAAEQQQQHSGQQQQIKELKAALELAQSNTVPVAEHRSLLQEAQEAASATARDVQARQIAQAAILENDHQLQQAKQELAAVQAELAALKEQRNSAMSVAQKHVAVAEQQAAALQGLAADSLQLLEQVVMKQQQCAGAAQLESAAQQLQAVVAGAHLRQQIPQTRSTEQRMVGNTELLHDVAAGALQLLEEAITQQQQQQDGPSTGGLQAVAQQLQAAASSYLQQCLIQQQLKEQLQQLQQQVVAAPEPDTAVAHAGAMNGHCVHKANGGPGSDRSTNLEGLQQQQQQQQDIQVAAPVQHQKQQRGPRATLAGAAAGAVAHSAPAAGGRSRRATMAPLAPVLIEEEEQQQQQQQQKHMLLQQEDNRAAAAATAQHTSKQFGSCTAAAPGSRAAAARRSQRVTLASAMPVLHEAQQQQPEGEVEVQDVEAGYAFTADALQLTVGQQDTCTAAAEGTTAAVHDKPAAQEPAAAVARRSRRATMAAAMPAVVEESEQLETTAVMPAPASSADEDGILAELPAAGSTRSRRRTLAGAATAAEHQSNSQQEAQQHVSAAVVKQRSCSRRRTMAATPAAAGELGAAGIGAAAAGSLVPLASITEIDESVQEQEAPAAAESLGAKQELLEAAAEGLATHGGEAAHGMEAATETASGTAKSRKRQRGKQTAKQDCVVTAAAAEEAQKEHTDLQQEEQKKEAAEEEETDACRIEVALTRKKQRRMPASSSVDADQQQPALAIEQAQSTAGEANGIACVPKEQMLLDAVKAAPAVEAAGVALNAAAAGCGSKARGCGKARSGGRAAKAPAKKQKRPMSVTHNEQLQPLKADAQRACADAVAQTASAGGSEHDTQHPSHAGAPAVLPAAAEAADSAAGASAANAEATAQPKANKLHRKAGGQLEQIREGGEDCWQPAERVLADVTQRQLGVAVGRRATIATMQGSKATNAAAGAGGAGKQGLRHVGGSITPVALRTRRRHG